MRKSKKFRLLDSETENWDKFKAEINHEQNNNKKSGGKENVK